MFSCFFLFPYLGIGNACISLMDICFYYETLTMRRMILMMLATVLGANMFAQSDVINGDFEQWSDSLTYREPDNWNTNNFFHASLGGTVIDTTDAQSGSLAAVVRTVYSVDLDDYFAGILTNGSSDDDSLGLVGDQISYRPEKLTGYYKYLAPVADTARVLLFMYRFDAGPDTNIFVATGNILLTPVNEYTYFEFPVLNATPGGGLPVPDTYVILITSTKDIANPVEGTSTLFIDNLNFTRPVSAPTLEDASDVSIYPNPVEDYFVISSPKHKVVAATVLSTEGRQVQRVESVSGANDLMVKTGRLGKGFYYVQLQLDNGAMETRFITVVK